MQAAVEKQGALCVVNDLPIEYSLAPPRKAFYLLDHSIVLSAVNRKLAWQVRDLA